MRPVLAPAARRLWRGYHDAPARPLPRTRGVLVEGLDDGAGASCRCSTGCARASRSSPTGQEGGLPRPPSPCSARSTRRACSWTPTRCRCPSPSATNATGSAPTSPRSRCTAAPERPTRCVPGARRASWSTARGVWARPSRAARGGRVSALSTSATQRPRAGKTSPWEVCARTTSDGLGLTRSRRAWARGARPPYRRSWC